MRTYEERADLCIAEARNVVEVIVDSLEIDESVKEEFEKYINDNDFAGQIVQFFEDGKIRAANDFLSVCVTPSSIGEDVVLFDAINNKFTSLCDQVEY